MSAELASWALRSRESLGRSPSRNGRRWQAVAGRRRRRWAARRWRGGMVWFCDPSATSLQSCLDPWGGASAQFIDSVDGVRDGVLLVLPSVVNRDRYPQLLSLSAGFGVLQYIDKVVDVPGDTVALWRLVKEFHIFSTCSRCSLGIWTLFPCAPCSGSHLPLCVATVHGSFWTNFVHFPREKWTPTTFCSSYLEI